MTEHNIKEEIKTTMPWVPAKYELEGNVITLVRAVVRPVYLLSLEKNSIAKSHFPVEESVVSEFQEGPNQDTCVPDRPSCTCGLASAQDTICLAHEMPVSLPKMSLKNGIL